MYNILHMLQMCSGKQASVLLCITVARCRLANAELTSLLMASFEQRCKIMCMIHCNRNQGQYN